MFVGTIEGWTGNRICTGKGKTVWLKPSPRRKEIHFVEQYQWLQTSMTVRLMFFFFLTFLVVFHIQISPIVCGSFFRTHFNCISSQTFRVHFQKIRFAPLKKILSACLTAKLVFACRFVLEFSFQNRALGFWVFKPAFCCFDFSDFRPQTPIVHFLPT